MKKTSKIKINKKVVVEDNTEYVSSFSKRVSKEVVSDTLTISDNIRKTCNALKASLTSVSKCTSDTTIKESKDRIRTAVAHLTTLKKVNLDRAMKNDVFGNNLRIITNTLGSISKILNSKHPHTSEHFKVAFNSEIEKSIKSIKKKAKSLKLESNVIDLREISSINTDMEDVLGSVDRCKLLTNNILAPFIKGAIHQPTFNALNLKYSTLGEGNASDYVILEDQIILALDKTKFKGLDLYELAKDIIENTESWKDLDLQIVDPKFSQVPQYKNIVCFWLMNSTNLGTFGSNMKIHTSALNWSVMADQK